MADSLRARDREPLIVERVYEPNDDAIRRAFAALLRQASEKQRRQAA